MDIRQMKYFMEICKHGSISRAADNLFITQQGLSGAIRRLEQELDCTLFYRKGGSLVLTEQGQYFLENAAPVVESFDKLQNHFLFASNPANTISLICVYNIIAKSPPALQHLLLGEDTGYRVSIGECYSQECAEYFESGECSFALSYEMPWCSRFESHHLFNVEHCFIVHRSHPLARYDEISIEQLRDMRMIMPDTKTAIRYRLDELFRLSGIQPTIVFATNQALQIYDLLAHDRTLVARVTLADSLAISNPDIKTLRLKDADFFTRVVLVHRGDRQLTPVQRLFRQEVLASAHSAGK